MMKYIDGFRDQSLAAKKLKEEIFHLSESLEVNGKIFTVMEVCGSHTMSIHRHGIRAFLPPSIRLISGPGCPVCVTDAGYLDCAISLAQKGCTIFSFSDLFKVPSSSLTLAQSKAMGLEINSCHSPMESLEYAKDHPQKEVVFLAIGFETTIPGIMVAARTAFESKISNFSMLLGFKLVPPALHALLTDPDLKIDAFLCPGHVSAIIGEEPYIPVVKRFRVPCVIAGFEPLDILLALRELVKMHAEGRADLVNQYKRVVKKQGNRIAVELISKMLIPADEPWRGIGVIPQSGYQFKEEFSSLCAVRKYGVQIVPASMSIPCDTCQIPANPIPDLFCADVLKGKIEPSSCPLFGKECNPISPVGPCMVSSEGSCAAWYRYSRSLL